MKAHLGTFLFGFTVAAFALLAADSRALAVDWMSDWTGLNNMTAPNNYAVISENSAGGEFESRVNFVNDATQSHMRYLSDPTLTAPLDFTTELHMKGTVTFSAPVNNNHNWFFGWYASTDTRYRIGLGVQGTTPAENNWIRWDFGYAATGVVGGNLFRSPTADGTDTVGAHNTDLPDGTYPFTFDYIPGPTGVMKVTVGSHFKDQGPVPNLALIPAGLDRFGFVQRTTAIDDPNVSFNLVMSNVTYTGGSAIGDANGDRYVDIFDVNVVSAHWGEIGPDGDVNGDFMVDIFDVNLISQYWSPAPPPGGGTAVPEPSSVVLAGLGLMGMCVVAWRRRQAVGR